MVDRHDYAADGGHAVVRPARLEDVAALTRLLRDFVLEEGNRPADAMTAEALTSWAFGPERRLELLIADAAGDAWGYLAYYPAFSLFKGAAVLLVENLYVAAPARGRGLGRRLLAAAALEARRRGFERLELHARSDRPEVHAFYARLGLHAPGESVYRIEDEALAALARLAE